MGGEDGGNGGQEGGEEGLRWKGRTGWRHVMYTSTCSFGCVHVCIHASLVAH